MPAEQLVNRYAQIHIQAACSRGYDLETIFNRSGIPPKNPSNTLFNLGELIKLSRNVKLLLKDEFCGFTKSGCKPGAFEMMVDLAVSAPTLADSLEKIFRFYSFLSTEIRFSLAMEGEMAAIQVEIANPEFDHHDFLCEWWLLSLWSLASWLVGQKIRCRRFELPHASKLDEAEYRFAWATECRFSQRNARFLFSRDYLKRPVVKGSTDVSELFLTRETFGEIPGTTDALEPRLYGLLTTHFSQYREFPQLSYVAAECHLSNQTLRRRLMEEGTSFNRIKDDIRRNIILNLLRSTNMSLSEITVSGGLSDTSSLARAVKNWTGFYPKQYRELIGQSH